jgi:glyoxylase-like metal-dependent hydrolase (beta-lactamase superfamily II)
MNPPLTLHPLSPHISWSSPDSVRDRPMMGAVMGSRATLIVEGGASPKHAQEFLAALADLGAAPARFAALTHYHWDHVFGCSALGVPVIAQRGTSQVMIAMARLDWRDAALDARMARGEERPVLADHIKIEMTDSERASLTITPPDLIFDDEVELDLGDLHARVIHVGGDHTPDSSIVFIPEERTVFLGDCLYNGAYGEAGWYYTPRNLFPLLDRLQALDADHYLLAHEEAPMTRDDLAREADTLRRIGTAVARDEALGAMNEEEKFYWECLVRGREVQG